MIIIDSIARKVKQIYNDAFELAIEKEIKKQEDKLEKELKCANPETE
jgi:hypothetical protein